MRPILIVIFLLINCAVCTAQSYHFKGLDLDTGANLVSNVYFDKQTKTIVLTSSSLLWHRVDSFERYKMINHFVKLNSSNAKLFDKYYQKENINTRILGNIKLYPNRYLAFGHEYDTKKQSMDYNDVPGYIVCYNAMGDSLFSKYFYFKNGNSSIYSTRQLKDSTIILLSRISNNQNLLSALRVIKLDKYFNTSFDSIYYYSDISNLNTPEILTYVDAIEETSDGGLLIGAELYTRNTIPQNHALLFKIDSVGKFLWERKYEFDKDMETEINKIIKLDDGNYLLVGYYNEFWKYPNIKDRIFLIKINPLGELISKKLIHAYESHYIYDALQKDNGDILLAGTFSKATGDTKSKAGLMCLNSQGDIKWHRQYELPSNMLHTQFESSNLSDIELANDGTIMAAGNISVIDTTIPYNNGGVQDLIFLYTDSNGCVDPTNCSFTTVEEEHVVPYYFQAYPNPSHGVFKFSTNIPLASSARIKIYNSFGQLIFEKETIDFTEALDLSNYPKGLYILELQSENLFSTQKLLIE